LQLEFEGINRNSPLEDNISFARISNGTDALTHVNDDHDKLVWFLFVATNVLLLAYLVNHAYHMHINQFFDWLPESVVFVVLGLSLGGILHRMVGSHRNDMFVFLKVTLLNFFLLPPIIFESGWSINRRDFFSQIEHILLFAVAGTVISTVITLWAAQWVLADILSLSLPFNLVFTFAALISAVDPVATLACYSSLHVERLLNIFVFGESVINDAVAIALFKAGNDALASGEELSVLYMCKKILTKLFGSIIVGVVAAVCLNIVMQGSRINSSPSLAAATMKLMPFIVYSLAEALHLSGIIAALFCGMYMGRFHGMGDEALALTGKMLKHDSMRADMVVFVFIGMSTIVLYESDSTGKGITLGLCICLICLFARACAVFPVGALVNLIKRIRGEEATSMLGIKHLFMMWHGGLRGGIAMALVLEIKHNNSSDLVVLQEATFVVIVVLLIVFGGSTKYFLTILGIKMGEENVDNNQFVRKTSLRFVVAAGATEMARSSLRFPGRTPQTLQEGEEYAGQEAAAEQS